MQAQAMLDRAEIELGHTEIRSPINARIGIAYFTVGNLVDQSSGRLATIVSQDPIYVIFQASQRDVLAYKRRVAESTDKNPHVTVRIRLLNGTIYEHPGVTNLLDVQVEPTTDTIAVRATVPNPSPVGCARSWMRWRPAFPTTSPTQFSLTPNVIVRSARSR
jgi:membrane fusion protein (multidrug efflux system)